MRFLKTLATASLSAVFALGGLTAAGCDSSDSSTGTSQPKADTPAPKVAEQPQPATKPLIPVAQLTDWCPEHGMPESICVQCNDSLAASFKAKGDWDDEHGLPKSQCFKCDPSLKEKFAAAFKEKHGTEPPAGTEGEHDHDHDDKGKAGTKG